MIPLNFDLPTLLRQTHHRSPIGIRLMTVMVLVGDVAVNHEVELVFAVGVDVGRLMIAVGDVRPDGVTEVTNFCDKRRGVNGGFRVGRRGCLLRRG